MITEDYVSFEISKLLKEKGFNEPCIMSFFDKDSYREWIETTPRPLYIDDESTEPFRYQQPTLQMTMKWLREIYHLDIAIYPYGDYPSDNYQFDVYRDRALIVSKDDGFISYEQACEVAIKYCLENLI